MAAVITAMAAAMPASADNWITPMPDNTYVSDLSIPGTHDSATGEGFQALSEKCSDRARHRRKTSP